jgi:hypothetical protein
MARRPETPMMPIMESKTVTITLQLKVAGDEVQGQAVNCSGDTRDFAGWLALIAAIDQLSGHLPVAEQVA